jgi:dephospho-CoA kinase
MRVFIALTGYTGSGKSTVATILNEIYENSQILSTGNIIRRLFHERALEENYSALEALNAKIMSEFGDGGIIDILLSDIRAASQVVIIDSIKKIGELQYLQSKVADLILISVGLSNDERINRTRLRARTTDPKSIDDFKDMFAREEDWGMSQLITQADIHLSNTDGIDVLRLTLMSAMESCIDKRATK